MKYSERSDHVGANVRPAVKQSLRDHIKRQREAGVSISMSRWIDEAICDRLKREGVSVVEMPLEQSSELLPFEEIA